LNYKIEQINHRNLSVPETKTELETVVIIGAGHGAAQAVQSLRQKKFEGHIILIGDEPYIPYHRPPLSKKFLEGGMTIERLYIKPDKFYENKSIEKRLGCRVTEINPSEKYVLIEGGEKIFFDHLIIATGSHLRKLTMQGAELKQVHYVQKISDVLEIQKNFEGVKDILVIGGGYIGLEIAAICRKCDKNVQLIHRSERLLSRVVAPEMSGFYHKVHEEEGVKITLNCQIVKIEEEGGRLKVTTTKGQEIVTDMIIAGIGVVPATQLAVTAGLKCDDGIYVDQYCRTSAADIYAIGDCTNHYNPLYNKRLRLESVPNAQGQAKVAAAMITGDEIIYDEIPWFWSDQYDMKLQIAGLSDGYDQIILRGNQEKRAFAAFYLKDNILIAVDAVNSAGEFMAGKKLIMSRAVLDVKKLSDKSISMKEFL
jgi:3-phenylpropionate/trans-cinnamate dioxygenase ferredoxin reductase subunit